MIEIPNKTYVLEYNGDNTIGMSHFVIIVAASDAEVARKYVKEQIGFDAAPTLLLNASFPAIYNAFGSAFLPVQTKILYNGNCYYTK